MRAKRLLLMVLTLALLAGAGTQVEPLHREQVRYDLTASPVQGVSPTILLATTALGAFRGVLVDLVWIRMSQLQEKGRFFEIAQLADLATKMEPNFVAVWDFQAWNMAYNITAEIPNLEDRWPWVKQGIELLRDEGIPANPTQPELYFQLGWIYVHKVGGELDDANVYYKLALGIEMHEVLGGPGTKEFLQKVVSAPGTDEQLLDDRRVRELCDALRAAGFDPLAKTGDVLEYFTYLRNPESIPGAACELLESNRNAYAKDKLEVYARARRLEGLKLRPEKMIELIDQYGPFDWRTPYGHAIYWASLGMEQVRGVRKRMAMTREELGHETLGEYEWVETVQRLEYDPIQYDRVIYRSLRALVTNGRLVYDDNGVLLSMTAPDYRFTDAMIREYEMLMNRHESKRYWEGISEGYKNFLIKLVEDYYYEGDNEASAKYFEMIKAKFPFVLKPLYAREDWSKVTHEQFVLDRIEDNLSVMKAGEIRTFIAGQISNSFYNQAIGNSKVAARYMGLAQNVTKAYVDSVRKTPTFNIDFNQMRQMVLRDIFAGRRGFPPEVIARLWEILPQAERLAIEQYLKQNLPPEERKPDQQPAEP